MLGVVAFRRHSSFEGLLRKWLFQSTNLGTTDVGAVESELIIDIKSAMDDEDPMVVTGVEDMSLCSCEVWQKKLPHIVGKVCQCVVRCADVHGRSWFSRSI
jgi:hypothetical protein